MTRNGRKMLLGFIMQIKLNRLNNQLIDWSTLIACFFLFKFSFTGAKCNRCARLTKLSKQFSLLVRCFSLLWLLSYLANGNVFGKGKLKKQKETTQLTRARLLLLCVLHIYIFCIQVGFIIIFLLLLTFILFFIFHSILNYFTSLMLNICHRKTCGCVRAVVTIAFVVLYYYYFFFPFNVLDNILVVASHVVVSFREEVRALNEILHFWLQTFLHFGNNFCWFSFKKSLFNSCLIILLCWFSRQDKMVDRLF